MEQVPLLQVQFAWIGGRNVRVCHVLWLASTFFGVLWLGLAYLWWLQRVSGPALGRGRVGSAVMFAALAMALAAGHYLAHGPFGMVAVGVCMVGLVVGFVWAAGR